MTRDPSLSKLLSYLLRHRPDAAGLTPDPAGWVLVDDLLMALRDRGLSVTRAALSQVVHESDKQRFAFSEDGLHIRANQGHSVQVELGYEPRVPPAVLYHGTVQRSLPAILEHGLTKRQRHHVHLSALPQTASVVGARRGHPVVLKVDAMAMHAAGYVFYCSPNGVWLTDHVPPQYIEQPNK